MAEYVLIASEAQAYYSGAFAREGVFLTKKIYSKYEDILSEVFEGKTFHELDGKHSETQGEKIFVEFDSFDEVAQYYNVEELDIVSYILEEELYYSNDLTEEELEFIVDDVNTIHNKLTDSSKYESVFFYLPKEEADLLKKISNLIKDEGLDLIVYSNAEYEDEEKALFNLASNEIIMAGDYYHNKISDKIEGFIMALEYLELYEERDVKLEDITSDHEHFKLLEFYTEN